MGDAAPLSTSFLDCLPVFSINNNASGTGWLLDYDQRSNNSLGFMELLNMQDFGPSLFDVLQAPIQSLETPQIQAQTSKVQLEEPSHEVRINAPATPNSSSISSESPGGHEKEEQEQNGHEKTKKHVKLKKTIQKKQKEPRLAFMTKSEVDHLEDGYRWRKYGQKAVKNSPFPRSYFKCTTASCNVKKRVERSFNDPSIVVTTYEGKHTHPSPTAAPPLFSGFSWGGAAPFPPEMVPSAEPHLNIMSSYGGAAHDDDDDHHHLRFCSTPNMAPWLTGHGLVPEMLPRYSTVKREDK